MESKQGNIIPNLNPGALYLDSEQRLCNSTPVLNGANIDVLVTEK